MYSTAVRSPARPLAAERVARVFRRYRADGDRRHRDELVVLLTPIVRHLVTRKVRSLPVHCERDDLASAGFEALVVAIDRFDPTRGVGLEQYVWTRVNGAILDELRAADWAPRSVRRRAREVEQARTALRGRLDHEPTDEEIAQRLGVDPSEVRGNRAQVDRAEVGSLSAPGHAGDDDATSWSDQLACDDPWGDPEAVATRGAARDLVARAVRDLPARERHTCELLYSEGLLLREIGDRIGVSESRAGQIVDAARTRLRGSLAVHEDLLAAG